VPEIAADLAALEADAFSLRLRWVQVLTWLSVVRPLQSRFLQLEAEVRAHGEHFRAMRERNWELFTRAGAPVADLALFPALVLPQLDDQRVLSGQLERVRFILAVKEGEAHARRGVYLGVLGAVLGAIGVVSLVWEILWWFLRERLDSSVLPV
jgi:hypothetical protein